MPSSRTLAAAGRECRVDVDLQFRHLASPSCAAVNGSVTSFGLLRVDGERVDRLVADHRDLLRLCEQSGLASYSR